MPKPLSGSYHFARRRLFLASGLLMAWCLLGVEINKAAGPDLNIPGFFGIVVQLKCPEVLPHILAIVLFYFLLQTILEFFQHSPDDRDSTPARIDLGASLTIAALALWLFMVHLWPPKTLVPSTEQYSMMASACLLGGMLGIFSGKRLEDQEFRGWRWNLVVSLIVAACLALVLSWYRMLPSHPTEASCNGDAATSLLYQVNASLFVVGSAITVGILATRLIIRKCPSGSRDK